jgi:hypothetical protein
MKITTKYDIGQIFWLPDISGKTIRYPKLCDCGKEIGSDFRKDNTFIPIEWRVDEIRLDPDIHYISYYIDSDREQQTEDIEEHNLCVCKEDCQKRCDELNKELRERK